jgi:hypothetical protein
MPKGMQPIFSQTISSSGSVLSFNNIPQTFTDLFIEINARTVYNGFADGYVYFQDGAGTSNYSSTITNGNGSSPGAYRYTNNGTLSLISMGGSNTTANTFSSIRIHIPNYKSNTYKQCISESVAENNATLGILSIHSGLWRSFLPVTQINFSIANGFAVGSTFTLYGISR